MRKPVYLGVLGGAVVVSAVSIGIAFTRYLSLRVYSPRPPARSPAATADRPSAALPPEEWRNLFAPSQEMKMPSRLAASSKGAAASPRANYILVGTIVSSNPSVSRAILWADGMKEPKAFRENEEVEPGAMLASVERDTAWIARGKEREKLELLPVGSPARGAAPSPGASRPTMAAGQQAAPDPSAEDPESSSVRRGRRPQRRLSSDPRSLE